MRGSTLRDLILTAALSLTMTVSLSFGAVLAIDHLLGQADEAELLSLSSPLVDSD